MSHFTIHLPPSIGFSPSDTCTCTHVTDSLRSAALSTGTSGHNQQPVPTLTVLDPGVHVTVVENNIDLGPLLS